MNNWAFIGASTIAQEWMLDAVRAQGDTIVAVLSSDQQRGAAFAKQHNIPRAYTNLADLLAKEQPQAVYISTTNELHKAQTLACAAAGAHIVCEKPLALTLADAEEMLAACKSAGVCLAVNHHLRAAAANAAIRDLLQQGAIGDLIAARVFHAVYLPAHLQGWRLDRPDAGGGVILDITVHNADLMAYLLDAHPRAVTAMAHSAGMGKGVEDSAMSVWQYVINGKDVLCYTHESFALPHAQTGLELHGSKGSIIAQDNLTQRATGRITLRTAAGEQTIPHTPRNLYQHAMQHFCAAINGNGAPLVDGPTGARALAVALAVLQSAKTRQTIQVDYGNLGT